jgi:hypothetical protein
MYKKRGWGFMMIIFYLLFNGFSLIREVWFLAMVDL